MNIKYVASLGGAVLGVGSAVRMFVKARGEDDKLRMAAAVISLASAGINIAIAVRDKRADDATSRVVELEDA